MLRPISLKIALGALLCLGVPDLPAHAKGGGGPMFANKFYGVKNLSWHGLQVAVWMLPSGIHAYRISYPLGTPAGAEGWHFCENPAGDSASLDECIGVSPQPLTR